MRHFVVTGCARSGTGYTAALLTHLGAATQHESVFSPYTTAFEGWGPQPGESSWLAAPFIDQLPADSVVLHQVRDPGDVVQSLLGLHFFDPHGSSARRDVRSLAQVARARGAAGLSRRLLSGGWRGRGRRLRSDFVQFTRVHCPEIFGTDDEVDRCWRYWVEWNQLIESNADRAQVAYRRFRVEDLDVPVVMGLLDLVGASRDEAHVQAALEAVPSTFNTRPAGPTSKARTRVPSEAGDLARRYGYRVDDA